MIDEGVFFCIIEIVDLLIVLYVRRKGEKSPLRKQAMLTHSLFTPPPFIKGGYGNKLPTLR